MLVKLITAYGKRMRLMCDGRCDKAWGINERPRKMLSDDQGDYVFIADQDLGDAPADPGTTEGFQGKPSATPLLDAAQMNKWCFRQCERSEAAEEGERVVLPDMSNPSPNMPQRATPGGKASEP